MKLWITKNKRGYVELWKHKPVYRLCCDGEMDWMDGERISSVISNLFPELTFENSPRQIEINYVMNGL